VLKLAGLDPGPISFQVRLPDLDRVPLRRAPRWLERAWGDRAAAMTLPWAIYVKAAVLGGDRMVLARLLTHELVHVRQWQQLGVVRFTVRYLTEYWRSRRRGLNHAQAYLAISLEREARDLSGS
jgi:hypothetical protein